MNLLVDATTVTVMASDVSSSGDSGGPWLQTYSGTGNVKAKGQHLGDVYVDGAWRSAYVPVVRISSRVSASILTQ